MSKKQGEHIPSQYFSECSCGWNTPLDTNAYKIYQAWREHMAASTPTVVEASGDLRAKVAQWHGTCSDYENQHNLESKSYGDSSYCAARFHRGAKEAFSRVLNELDSCLAAQPASLERLPTLAEIEKVRNAVKEHEAF